MNARHPGRGPCRPLRAALQNALQAVWLAALLAGCGGGEEPAPPEEPPLELGSISRSWQLERFLGQGRALSQIISFPESRVDVPGRVGDEFELGGLTFNAPDGGDAIARLELYSSDDGMTYWVGAQAPNGAIGDGRAVGGRVQFQQHQRWRKKAVDATLKYVITELQLDLIDYNQQSLTSQECPWGERFTYNDCYKTLYTRILFNFAARADRDPSTFGSVETLIGRDGVAELHGWVGNWGHDLEEDWWGVWEPKDFTVEYDVIGDGEKRHARIKLIKPITIVVPIGALPLGSDILVETAITAEAMNNRRRESYAGAWFRDPARTGGASFEVTGLEPVPLQEVPPADPQQDPSPVCPGAADPAAGSIAFEATDIVTDELPGGARVVLVREGGSAGDVSVELRTRDGTATAGSDYAATTRRIWFRDGQTRRTLRIPVLLDAEAEPNETLTLAIADPRGCAALGTRQEATVTIRDDDRPAPQPPSSYRVGGTVSGLVGSGLVLRDEAQAVSLAVAANGRFEFNRAYSTGAAYDVRVTGQPSGPTQVCSITRGSGTVAADVMDVAVDCVTPPPVAGFDATFGSGGRVTTGPAGVAKAIGLQSDGRIVAAIGNTVARYLPDGTLDTTFGSNGSTPNVLGSTNTGAEIYDLVVQPDGRIVVAGTARGNSFSTLAYDFAAARLNADGSRDSGFNGGQPLQVDWIGAPDRATRVLLQPDGRIVLAGTATTVYTSSTDDSAMALVRLNTDGSLDGSFGSGGRAVAEFAQLDFGQAAALQSDGRIVVAGRVSVNRADESRFGAARFNADGTLDTGFGSGGRVYIDTLADAQALVLQPDGRLLLGLAQSDAGNLAFGLLRLNADGSRDAGFGSNGLAISQIGSGADTPAALALQADGRIVVAGYTLDTTTSFDAVVARFRSDGALDTGFGSGGFYQLDLFGGRDGANDVLVQPDGKLLVSGSAGNGLSTQPLLLRIVP